MNDAKVRIFVSSPADVEHERGIVKDIIERLAQEFLPYFTLEPILWEEEALTADRTFQAGLVPPAECDIVLVVVWTRLGSPLPQDPFQGMTGTEWEFFNAVEAGGEGRRPEVLVYKKTNPKLVDITNPKATLEAIEDRKRLEEFFQRHFFNEDRTFRRAFRTFDSDADFRNLVEVQLRKLLNRRIFVEKRGAAQGTQWYGSPFRPAGPYELADERIFTGREGETRDLLHRLQERMEAGRGLLLLSGPSGCGKSSLVRAGLLPRLVRPYQIEGVAGCRWCLVDPRAAGDPLLVLAEALCTPGVLGEVLGGFGLDPPLLRRSLELEPEIAATQLRAALDGLARVLRDETGESAAVRLMVVVDPLEALAPAAAAGFGSALSAIAESGAAWVLALLRSDHLARVPELGALGAALDPTAWIRLDPPAPARIRQVIEIPALVAGLEYENPPGRGLVDLLESEAARLRLWAPLLQGALDHLYARSAGASGRPERLRVAELRASGGLAGEALRRADRLWDGLDEDARAALPRLCRALVTLEAKVKARPVPRTGDLDILETDPACRRLLQAMIEARLVLAEGEPDPVLTAPCPQPDYSLRGTLGRVVRETREEWRARRARPAELAVEGPGAMPTATPGTETDWSSYRRTATLAHPVLIERWAPMRDWLADPANREVLRLRAQITRQAQLWKRTDCNREYLLGESGYAAAARLAADRGAELEPAEAELIAQSDAFLRYQRRGNRLVRITGALLAALLVLATLAALWAQDASRSATLNLHRSQLNAADLAIARGNTPRAVVLALNAAPYLPYPALETLSRAFTSNRLIAMARLAVAADERPVAPAFSADGRYLATAVPGQGARLWRLGDGRYVPERELDGTDLDLQGLVLRQTSEGEAQVLGIGPEGIWRLPAAPGAPPDWPCGGAAPIVTAVAPSGLVALAHAAERDRFAVCVFDPARPGELRFDTPVHQGEIRGLGFSPDGTELVTASRDGSARLLAAETGETLLTLPPGGPLRRPVNRAVFDAAGERIALAAADETVRVYGRDGRLARELAWAEVGGRRYKVHSTAVRDVAFSPDGQYLLAVDDEGQVVRWDLGADARAAVLGQHDLSAEQVRVGLGTGRWEGVPLVLTASLDKSARLWHMDTGKELAVFSHDDAVGSAEFAAGGDRVTTHSVADGSARLWSLEPVSRLAYALPHDDHVWHLDLAAAPVELDPDGRLLLVASADFAGRARIWAYDRASGGQPPEPLWTLDGHEERIRRVAFSPSARWLATAAYDGTARVWDVTAGTAACVLPVRSDGGRVEVYHALFSPDERWLVTASNDPDGPLRLWDLQECAALPAGDLAAPGPRAQVAAVAARGAGDVLIASGDDAGRLRVLRKRPGQAPELLCTLTPHAGAVADLTFGEDGRWLASAAEDGRAALVEIAQDSCGEPRLLDGHAGALYSVHFSPDGTRLITASLDGTARVWHRDGRLLATLVGHRDRIYRAELSPRGDFALTASRDGAVRVWKVPPAAQEGTLASYLVLDAKLGGVAFAAFSPDGRYLAGAYWENAAVLWRLWTEDEDTPAGLAAAWGGERARLAIVREAARFRAENRLDEGGLARDQ
ncbi:MAG: WD40 repeat domain-containing protein [Chromatiaceae bacterium]|jgi:WD40 repeat protein|nr:WD40 repeat domain-containing protein [Chromatiaceae bacterium]